MWVQALTHGVVWAMSRTTFRDIVLAGRVQKRACYEEVLGDMRIFTTCLQPTGVLLQTVSQLSLIGVLCGAECAHAHSHPLGSCRCRGPLLEPHFWPT